MLRLHEVTKFVGRGTRRRLILDAISWEIPPRAKIAILAHPGSGKTTFLNALSGGRMPTSGWIERRGIVSPLSSLSRQGGPLTTPRQLIARLAPFFNYEPTDMVDFIERFAGLQGRMDSPLQNLNPVTTQALNLALFYGIPCDYYLIDQRINLGPREIRARVWEAYLQRRRHAGFIMATSLAKEARKVGGAGAILHRGKIVMFDTVEDAIEVFSQIEPDALPADEMGRFEDEVPPDQEYDF